MERTLNGTERKTDKGLDYRDGATDTSAIRNKRNYSHKEELSQNRTVVCGEYGKSLNRE